MIRVLLVAATTGYQIRSFGEAANALGVRLVFASDRCDRLDDPWRDQAIPVRFHDPARSIAAAVAACVTTPVAAVLAVGDKPALFASELAQALGIPGHPPEAAAVSRNKLATRKALLSAGLPTPEFFAVSVTADPAALAHRVEYPAVVKPLALSGSRGVVRVDDAAGLATAFVRLRALLGARDVRLERDEAHESVLVESFIPGAEYAVEGLLNRGSLQVLAVIDKPDPLDGPYFEETIYRMPSMASPETIERLITAVGDACTAIGLYHGAIHAECRVDTRAHPGAPRVHVLEVAARPIGGLCSRALRFRRQRTDSRQPGGVISLEEVLLRHALGEDVSDCVREADASGVMMIPIPRRGIYRRVEGVDQAKAVGGVADILITAKPDSLLVPLPEGKSYLGFIFARGRVPSDVDHALREAHGRLHFVVDREVAVL